MEIGNEISQKIRSAIKAKLVDLGAYDDEELPDYVMVMVANKKNQQQMTEDLGLFLGNNTEKFTLWLHALLKKLQTITADSKEKAAADKDSAMKAMSQPSEQPEQVSIYEEPDEPILTLRPETDEFEEEARREAVTSMQQKTARLGLRTGQRSTDLVTSQIAKSPPQAGASSGPKVVVSRTSPRTSESSQTRAVTETVKPAISKVFKETLKSSAINVTPAEGKPRSLGEGTRKRRIPGSVIGSVVKHYDEYEEEGYDPHKPLIGKVASKVRVGDRRPTVPPSQQANKSLVMKAMTEAHDSVERMRRRRAEKSPVRSYPQQRVAGHRHLHRGQTSVQPGSSRIRKPPQEIRTITRGGPVPHQAQPERSIALFSRSKRKDIMQRFRAQLSSDEESQEENNTTASKKRQNNKDESDYVDLGESADNRLIQCEGHEKVEDPIKEERLVRVDPLPDSKTRTDQVELELDLETLIESGAEESEFTDGEEEERMIENKPSPMPKERPSSPKFVVTLDGIDPKILKHKTETDVAAEEGDTEDDGEEEEMEEVEIDEAEDSLRYVGNVVKVKPLQAQPQLEEGPSAPKRARSVERCKFWPSCKNGEDCPFHHPTEQCRMFPGCNFGDRCRFIHPNCKFDANCTRPACPYTHACKAPSQTAMPVVIQPVRVPVYSMPRMPFISPIRHSTPTRPTGIRGETMCRFFPRCTNMNCPFKHPKPCRYGYSCGTKATCTFSHPQLPSKDQMKWAPPKAGSSSSISSSGT